MQEQSNAPPLLNVLSQSALRLAAILVIQFLDPSELEILQRALDPNDPQQHPQQQKEISPFLELVRTQLFFLKYLNRTDRSMYYTFYEQSIFKGTQNRMIASLSVQQARIFQTFPNKYQQIINDIISNFPQIQEQRQMIMGLVCDPQLPLPKMRRQTVGMFCNSTFQFYLASLKFNSKQNSDAEYTCFQQLKQCMNFELEQKTIKQFIHIFNRDRSKGSQFSQLSKITLLRYASYEITYQNYQNYTIQECPLHNFLVNLMALTDVMLKATSQFVNIISDPLSRWVEFMLRYSIFRNYVLSIEENLSFVWQLYGSIYRDTIKDIPPNKPNLSFWRPAMTKWYLYMKKFHPECDGMWRLAATILRDEQIVTILSEKSEQNDQNSQFNQSQLILIQNRAEMKETQMYLQKQLFGGTLASSSLLSQFFSSSPDLYMTLSLEYLEYLIDLSVNEETVHFCGHSNHQMELPYRQFEKGWLKWNQLYVQTVIGKDYCKNKGQIIEREMQWMLNEGIAKPVTLLKVIEDLSHNYVMQSKENSADHRAFQEMLALFSQQDNKLQYFNSKSFILASISQPLLPFYSIPPVLSALQMQELLKQSIETGISQSDIDNKSLGIGSEEQEEYYFSEGQAVESEEQPEVKKEKAKTLQDNEAQEQEKEQEMQIQEKKSMPQEKNEKSQRTESENPFEYIFKLSISKDLEPKINWKISQESEEPQEEEYEAEGEEEIEDSIFLNMI